MRADVMKDAAVDRKDSGRKNFLPAESFAQCWASLEAAGG